MNNIAQKPVLDMKLVPDGGNIDEISNKNSMTFFAVVLFIHAE